MENTKVNIYEKVESIRASLLDAKLKKTGQNKFSDFMYYTLDDIMPAITKEMQKHKVFSLFNIENETATLTLFNIDNPTEQVVFTSPIAEANIKGATPVQCLGGIHTYLKRYLYLNAFEITEPDILDALAGSEKLEAKGTYKPKANKLDADLLNEAERLKINLDRLAAYFKKAVGQLTNEDLKKAIEQKQTALKGAKND